MIDIQIILREPEKIKEVIRNKRPGGISEQDVDRLIELYNQIKQLKTQLQAVNYKRNQLAKASHLPAEEKREQGRHLKEKISTLQNELKVLEDQFEQIYQYIPGLYSEDTPIGPDESSNVVVREWGRKPQFDFVPKKHYELMSKLGLDTDRGTKVAGFRGYFLKGDLALLHWAVLTYAFLFIVGKGYMPVIPPTIAKEFALFGAGQFPWGRDDTFEIKNPHAKENYFLIGTAEQSLMAMYANETFEEEQLPVRIVGFSPAYRREVGAHHKDLKGVVRVHEFWKVEQVIIAPSDQKITYSLHDELTQNAEEIMQNLGIPYRVLAMCTGDMGNPHYRKFDIEAWLPGSERYRETHSSSIMADFQARRNNIKMKTKDGKKVYVWSLNNTAIASPRILTAIVENYQNADGSVTVPEVLRPYMLGKTRLEPYDNVY